MDKADELAAFIALYLDTVCASHGCNKCPFFNPAPAPTHIESHRCRINYANYILKAKGLEPQW